MRNRLGDTIDPATAVRTFEREHGALTWSDLELLASIEDFHRETEPQPGAIGTETEE
jgi:hypothetical protein